MNIVYPPILAIPLNNRILNIYYENYNFYTIESGKMSKTMKFNDHGACLGSSWWAGERWMNNSDLYNSQVITL